jgi:pyruvate,water dikinase
MHAIIFLSDLRRNDIALAGGKAANLGELIAGGFPVPPGFCILTQAYWDYINYNHLQSTILSLIKTVDLNNPRSADSASQAIRTLFERSVPPLELSDDILEAYHTLGEVQPVAVRSSATAEDLPELSFAGQQDTFLNIIGEEQLLMAVRQAWSSLWTSRAIVYRLKNKIPHEDVALAVVVQQMVSSEASGILFTANPLSGRRGEIVIDAVFGMGEALVSGQVEPDQYLIEPGATYIRKTLGEKALASRPLASGGVQMQKEDANLQQALPDNAILELVRLGRNLEEHFKQPQDAEWAWAGEKLYIVQSRPITSLYPLPERLPGKSLSVLGSFGALQGMLDPMTPLGQDIIKSYEVGLGLRFGRSYTIENQPLFFSAGERLFMNITPLLHNRFGRRIILGVLGAIEPGTRPAVKAILDEPVFTPGKRALSASAFFTLTKFILPVLARVPGNMIAPDAARRRLSLRIDKFLRQVERRASSARLLTDWLALSDYFMDALPRLMVYHIIPKFGPAVGMLYVLNHLGNNLPEGRNLALEITRGLPYNVTTEMDLELWKTSQAIQKDETSLSLFSAWEARALAEAYMHGKLPLISQAALADFISRYGFRGPGEIDIGRPRWRDDPIPLIQALQGYLAIHDAAQSPDEIFHRGAQRAQQAISELANGLRQKPGGFLRASYVRFAARRVRALSGLREMPKFIAVRTMGYLRQGLLATAECMVAAHLLEQPDDIFFLHISELNELAALQNPDATWSPDIAQVTFAKQIFAKIAERRQRYIRELARQQIPRLLLSDGRAFYEGIANIQTDRSFHGEPVSPGVVEGLVRVVFDPRRAELQPGEILVCPGTDPSWTPLFLSAVGIVMEVGGLMTHGSVVAREYGIPAVVGVTQATQRLKTGQRIRLDGSTGRIDLL